MYPPLGCGVFGLVENEVPPPRPAFGPSGWWLSCGGLVSTQGSRVPGRGQSWQGWCPLLPEEAAGPGLVLQTKTLPGGILEPALRCMGPWRRAAGARVTPGALLSPTGPHARTVSLWVPPWAGGRGLTPPSEASFSLEAPPGSSFSRQPPASCPACTHLPALRALPLTVSARPTRFWSRTCSHVLRGLRTEPVPSSRHKAGPGAVTTDISVQDRLPAGPLTKPFGGTAAGWAGVDGPPALV